jgi:hypothetical protein
MIAIEQITAAIQKVFPQNTIRALTDRGDWLKNEEMIAIQQGWRGNRVIDFTLDTGKRYCIKIHAESTWDDGFKGELQGIALLREHNLPAPEVVFAETSPKTLGAPFYIAERLEGVKLLTLWFQVSEQEKCRIFSELGQFYKRMHTIHASKSGLISPDDPYASRYPNVHPNDHMFEAELKNGSGKRALRADICRKRPTMR